MHVNVNYHGSQRASYAERGFPPASPTAFHFGFNKSLETYSLPARLFQLLEWSRLHFEPSTCFPDVCIPWVSICPLVYSNRVLLPSYPAAHWIYEDDFQFFKLVFSKVRLAEQLVCMMLLDVLIKQTDKTRLRK